MTVSVEFPMGSGYPDIGSLLDSDLKASKGIPDSVLETINEIEPQEAQRKISIEIPVPTDRIAIRDGSLDTWLSRLLSNPVRHRNITKPGYGDSTIEFGGAGCGFGGDYYPDGSRVHYVSCTGFQQIAYSMTCRNGTWHVDTFIADAASLCP